MKKNWIVNLVDGQRHVSPIDDIKMHDLGTDCFCRPQNDEGVVVHNSLDQREKFET